MLRLNSSCCRFIATVRCCAVHPPVDLKRSERAFILGALQQPFQLRSRNEVTSLTVSLIRPTEQPQDLALVVHGRSSRHSFNNPTTAYNFFARSELPTGSIKMRIRSEDSRNITPGKVGGAINVNVPR